MSKQRLQDVYAKGLEAMGYTELLSKNKYRIFHKQGSSIAYIFVGKKGAVRYNALNRVVGSVPFGPKNLARIVEKATGGDNGKA